MTFEEWFESLGLVYQKTGQGTHCNVNEVQSKVKEWLKKAFEAGHTQGWNEAIDEYKPFG